MGLHRLYVFVCHGSVMKTEIKIKKVQKDAHEKNSKTITSDGPCASNKLQLKEMLAAPFFFS
jgi:hypothetical protein